MGLAQPQVDGLPFLIQLAEDVVKAAGAAAGGDLDGQMGIDVGEQGGGDGSVFVDVDVVGRRVQIGWGQVDGDVAGIRPAADGGGQALEGPGRGRAGFSRLADEFFFACLLYTSRCV